MPSPFMRWVLVSRIVRAGEGVVLALEKSALGRVPASSNSGAVRRGRLMMAPEPPQQVGANRMEQVVRTEIQSVDQCERRMRSLNFGDSDGAIESNHGTRRQQEKTVVQLEDVRPVRFRGRRRLAVNHVDRRLQLIQARSVVREALPHERSAFGDETAIPPLAVLVAQQHELAVDAE